MLSLEDGTNIDVVLKAKHQSLPKKHIFHIIISIDNTADIIMVQTF